MTATSFRNNTRFAYTIKFLRETLKMDISEVGAEKGPARSYVTNIERCDEMPITDATIDKYATAFRNAKPSNGFATMDPSLESFLRAYATLFKAAEDAKGTGERDTALAEERQWSPDKQKNMAGRRLFIGIDIVTGEPMSCDVLTRPNSKTPDDMRSIPAAVCGYEDKTAADHMLVKIAQDQPALTLIPHRFSPSERFMGSRGWLNWSLRGGDRLSFGVSQQAFTKAVIDPIANVDSLDTALERAQALGATGTDMVTLAWLILTANADAARAGLRTPIECLELDRPASRLDVEFTGTVPPAVLMKLAAERYLLPWALQHTVATWDVRYDIEKTDSAEEQINTVTWTTNERAATAAAGFNGYGVCLYDDKQFPQLAAVLEDLNRAAITYTPGRLAGDEKHGQTWELCTVGPHPAFGLVRATGTDEWKPVQLYPYHSGVAADPEE